jgi:4-hydroxy-tetrahydrodipicolinate synthase
MMHQHHPYGIIPPLITPLTPQGCLDVYSLERVIAHVIAGGINGIFLLGSTGEGPALSETIRKELIREGVRLVAGRIPLFINISAASYMETIHIAEFAAREGADYVVLSPPFYFEMNTHELLHYYRSVADRSPLPMVIYNAPKYTKTIVDPGLVGELQMHQNIIGIKDSSGSMDYIRNLLDVRVIETFSILIGPELLLGESLLLGCNGGVCGGANLYPGLYAKYYQVAMEKNTDELERIKAIFRNIQTNLYEVAQSTMGIVIGLKYLLSQRGLCSGQMAMPVYKALSSEQKKKLNMLDQEILQI